MKKYFRGLFGLLAIITLVISLVPMASQPQAAEADPGLLKWSTIDTPVMYPLTNWVTKSADAKVFSDAANTVPLTPHPTRFFRSEVNKLAVGSDSKTMWAVDIANMDNLTGYEGLYKSTNGGIWWSDKFGTFLHTAYVEAYGTDVNFRVWDIALAPDNPNFVAVVVGNDLTDPTNVARDAPARVFISTDGGTSWDNAGVTGDMLWIDLNQNDLNDEVTFDELFIGAIAVSPDRAGIRDIAIGTRLPDGTWTGDIFMVAVGAAIPGWKNQLLDINMGTPVAESSDVLKIVFSPNYAGDGFLGVIAATGTLFGSRALDNNLFLNAGFHNFQNRTTLWNSAIGPHFTGYPIEVTNISSGSSLGDNDVFSADLELPSDFNGDDARSRIYFVSYDARISTEALITNQADVYRLNDTVVYRLNVPIPINVAIGDTEKRTSSIAYFGTTTSGAKLLAGQVYGDKCSATVQVYHSLDALACPGNCWTASWKPPTGGAGVECASPNQGWGNAQVAWNPDGTKSYTGTSSAQFMDAGVNFGNDSGGAPVAHWPFGYLFTRVVDESAFSVSRNDGVSWNQWSLIDTVIDKLTDVAPAADCAIAYVESENFYGHGRQDLKGTREELPPLLQDQNCSAFDSVWRTPNFDLKGTALGTTWERVLTKATTDKPCGVEQADFSILRLAPDKTDGSIIAWAAGGVDSDTPYATGRFFPDGTPVMTRNTKAVMWSEDFGEIWYPIRPAIPVQDMTFESSSILYVLDASGRVQKLTYARPNWRGAAEVDACLGSGKSIAALAQGHVLVGPLAGVGMVAYSADGGVTFSQTSRTMETTGKVHVAFHPKFLDNKTFFAGDEDGAGAIYRWVWGTSTEWIEISNNRSPVHGIVLSNEGTLYAARVNPTAVAGAAAANEPIMALVSVGLNGGPEVVAITYRDQNGSASITNFTLPAAAPAGTTVAITLQAGDTGVRDVTGLARVSGTSTLGVFAIIGTGVGTAFALGNYIPGPLLTFTDGAALAAGTATVASFVDRTLTPLSGIPKPGLAWNQLNYNLPNGVAFSLEPGSLKWCGSLTLDTYTTLYAFDDRYYDPRPNVKKGMLWNYTDCLAKKAPTLQPTAFMYQAGVKEPEPAIIGVDPVSGRNQEFTIEWEQLCLATKYQVVLYKGDKDTIWADFIVDLTASAQKTKPRYTFAAGQTFGGVPFASGSSDLGGITLGMPSQVMFEAGHTYWWKVRVRGSAYEANIVSPYSAQASFVIKAGLPVTSPYIGPLLLAPVNGAPGVPIKGVSFSWSTFKESTEYQFQVAEDAAMTKILADAKVPTTAYGYAKDLKYSTNYYWRVMVTKPVISDWSPVYSFMTEKAPPPPPPPPPPPAPPPPTPTWVWVIIALGAVLILLTLILIVRTRRV